MLLSTNPAVIQNDTMFLFTGFNNELLISFLQVFKPHTELIDLTFSYFDRRAINYFGLYQSHYSRVRNKHSPMIIKFLTFFQGLRPYSRLHSIG